MKQLIPTSRTNYSLATLAFCSALLVACQAPVVNPNSSNGQASLPQVVEPKKPTNKPTTKPAQQPKTNPTKPKNTTTRPPRRASSKEILKRQRQQQTRKPSTRQSNKRKDGRHIPAFNKLMKIGINQLRTGKLDSAQHTFTKAQRLGPESPAVYMYLSEIAIKKRQGTQAENLARRGLLVSRSARYDKALWKMVRISGKMRNRTSVIKEAERNLARLK